MQVAQLMGDDDGRARMLAALRDVLEPGGLLAVALADPFEGIPADEVLPPLPDVLEVDGWVCPPCRSLSGRSTDRWRSTAAARPSRRPES